MKLRSIFEKGWNYSCSGDCFKKMKVLQDKVVQRICSSNNENDMAGKLASSIPAFLGEFYCILKLQCYNKIVSTNFSGKVEVKIEISYFVRFHET